MRAGFVDTRRPTRTTCELTDWPEADAAKLSASGQSLLTVNLRSVNATPHRMARNINKIAAEKKVVSKPHFDSPEIFSDCGTTAIYKFPSLLQVSAQRLGFVQAGLHAECFRRPQERNVTGGRVVRVAISQSFDVAFRYEQRIDLIPEALGIFFVG